MGKWAETPQTLINKGLARGHFSKKKWAKAQVFWAEIDQVIFRPVLCPEKVGKSPVLEHKSGQKF